MAPQISLHELYRMKRQKETNKTLCFDKVLEMCHRRIRNIAAHGGMNTFYEIPGMIVGLPLYNITQCTEYVIEQLRKSGFLVQLLPPPSVFVVYVSWDPEEIKPMKKSEPTLPAPAATNPTLKQNKLRLF
jgi:hypothetical protein